MRCILISLLFFFVVQLSAQGPISAIEWQEDLRFLQETIHNDYAFLFVKTTPEAFDAEVEQLYQAIPTLQEHEVIIGMTKIVALFKYGHTGIWFFQQPAEFHYLPLNLYQFEEDIHIQGVHKDYANAIGAKVLEVNGIEIGKAIDMIAPVVNAENDQYFKAYGINYLANLEVLHAQRITKTLQQQLELTLEKNGTVFTQTFTALPKGQGAPRQNGFVFEGEDWLEAREQGNTPHYLKHLDKIYYQEFIEAEKTLYVRHSQIQDDPEEPTRVFYDRVFQFIETNDVEKLVIDVRLNGGGNNFLNRDVVQGIIRTEKINQVGKLFVITGRRTFSACQNLVNELDNYTNALFVGEGTAENINFWGDARRVALPNSGLPVYLSYAWWQDKTPWQNAEGTSPMLPVELSFEQYQNNQDPALDAVFAFDDSDFRRDPMRYITQLYISGDMQRMMEEIPQIVFDPKYSFVDFESEFLKSGDRMFKNGRESDLQAGLQIFGMTTQLFPNSARAFKKLGESYLLVGEANQGKALLNKAMTLDTRGEFVEEIQALLSTID
ncbi:MAG: hypothetical protein KTR13_02405 [Saprospiraceae bacterium]|nr:hypothetical protein [Saprospiraceae bacterium]